jgi:hypothetical protein
VPINFDIKRAFSLKPLIERYPLLGWYTQPLEYEIDSYLTDIMQEIERRLIPASTCIKNTVDQSIADTTLTLVAWDTVVVDDLGGADLTNEAIVIPRGVHYVNWVASLRVADIGAGHWAGDMYLNNVTAVGYGDSKVSNFNGSDRLLMIGRIVEVFAGDIVNVKVTQTSGGNEPVLAGSYFIVNYLRG